MSETRILKHVINWKPPGRRKPGRPRSGQEGINKIIRKGTWEMICGKTGKNKESASEDMLCYDYIVIIIKVLQILD